MFCFALICNLSSVLCKWHILISSQTFHWYAYSTVSHRGFAVVFPGIALVTPGSVADARGRAVAYRDAPRHHVAPPGLPGSVPSQTVAYPGQTVTTLCPKPGLVCSTAGNVGTHSSSFTVRPGSPATNCRGTPGRTPGQCKRDYRCCVSNFYYYLLFQLSDNNSLINDQMSVKSANQVQAQQNRFICVNHSIWY